MKRIFTLLIILSTYFSLDAQDTRYLDEIFTDVDVTTEIYGTNATLLFLPVVGEAVPIPLPMDIYTPSGDTETNRPVMLVFHTGNFLPNVTNGQIPGTRTDSSAVEICMQLARRGYVAASVDYRLGWNPLAPTQPERALGLIQAAYRGVQDGRTAVRFMRSTVDAGNPYGINPDRISVLGTGTGGYLTLGMVGLSDYNEILTTQNGPGKFLLDVIDASTGMPGQDGMPETPMIIEPFHGDIEGKVMTVTPLDGSSVAFGLPPGDTTNIANHVDYSSDISLGINIGGALGDISWLADNTTPTISIQDPFDIFAPYNDAVLIVPTTNDPIVQVQGAQQIGLTQEANGANEILTRNTRFDDATTQMAMDNSVIAGHPYYEGVFPFIRPVNSLGIPEGVVIDWWDAGAPSPADGQGMGIPWNQLPHPSGGTFHDQGLRLNENMSAEKARANIDLCMSYILPRACVALELPCNQLFLEESDTEEVISSTQATVSPNPASTDMHIQSADYLIQSIDIVDMEGKLVYSVTDLNDRFHTVDRSGFNSGMYILQIRFEEGQISKKVIFE